MTDEILAEAAKQGMPEGFDAALMPDLTKAVVDALLGLRSGRIITERKAAESIVTKLSQLVK